MKLTFLGATKTVTGSKYLLESAGKKYLIDCGLFQGYKELRLRNWRDFPVPPSSIEAIILTHAHIDHSGYIPRLVKLGFKGKVYCTPATHELCKILLKDCAYLQEEDARRANRYHYTKHKPALPLYTMEDADRSLDLFHIVDFHHPFTLDNQLEFTFHHAGHILGSAFVRVSGKGKTITFSGDLGRLHDSVMKPPEKPQDTDYLILESTYGNRLHEKSNPLDQMQEIMTRTFSRRGILLIPAFAVGRTQSILYFINELQKSKKVPNVPVFVDSPMATSATKLLCNYTDELRLSKPLCDTVCNNATYVREVEESKALNNITTSSIIISASGMATGGRVLHHLKHLLGDPKNAILFAGFQAGGTRGDRLVKGETEIKIHGQMFPVRAQIENLDNMSAHGDYEEILTWLESFSRPPKKVYLTHGEAESSASFRDKIGSRLGWEAVVPDYLHSVTL